MGKYKVAKDLKGLHWKRNGRMMGKNQWYGSELHLRTEAHYDQYKKAYKKKYRR